METDDARRRAFRGAAYPLRIAFGVVDADWASGMSPTSVSFQLRHPTVYLDQWVWVRLAKAELGRPLEPEDVYALEAVKEASAAGVSFPLSVTHYEETARLTGQRQRRDLATFTARVSRMQTLRSRLVLLRHQFLVALHETIGRPTFRPPNPQVIGVGVHWAFTGEQAFFKAVGPDGTLLETVDGAWLRHLNEYGEAAVFAGPGNEALPRLIKLGYVMPRELETQEGNRVDNENAFLDVLGGRNIDREVLRVTVMARELAHYMGLLSSVLEEYRLSLQAITGAGGTMASRARAIAFTERAPTARISADMKVEILRNKARRWTWNMLRDIDALSVAVPYCHVVVADRDATDLLRRTGAPQRYNTVVSSSLRELPELLHDLPPSDPLVKGPWDVLGPAADEYRLYGPEPLTPQQVVPGTTLKLVDEDGLEVPRPRA